MTQARGDGSVTGMTLASSEVCQPCHADVVRQWRSSAHAMASFDNPIYRLSVDDFRRQVGKRASRFCGGCHDVALLLDGAMTGVVRPDDPRAQAGVGCLACHGIDRVMMDGNGSYRMVTDAVVIPTAGDEQSLTLHRRRLAYAPLRQAALCGSCHRAFLGVHSGNGHHLAGADDWSGWQQSAYGGSRVDRVELAALQPRNCQGCHMPTVAVRDREVSATGGLVRSHRFAAGHTWLAAMVGDAEQLRQARLLLRGAARVEVAAVALPSGRRLRPQMADEARLHDRFWLEVVVTNEHAGHRFPAGTADAHDVWLEVLVRDANGRVVARDGNSHRLRSAPVGDDGRPLNARQVHRFRAIAYDTTIAPRDSVVVRYRLEHPKDLAWPLHAQVRLLHRSRSAELQRLACEASRSERGRRFAQARRDAGKPALSPCAPQPLTLIAATATRIGAALAHATAGTVAGNDAVKPTTGLPTDADGTTVAGLLRHGRGWSRALVERLDPAVTSLVAALRRATAPTARAAAMVALSRVAGRRGRVADALALSHRAELLQPGHAATSWARGLALARVWRWPEAIEAFETTALRAPGDPRVWRQLALARGSGARHVAALYAAREGLKLLPRDAALLRSRALALQQLAPGAWCQGDCVAMRRSALRLYLTHRLRDDASRFRSMCADSVAGCAIERNPVHEHILERVP